MFMARVFGLLTLFLLAIAPAPAQAHSGDWGPSLDGAFIDPTEPGPCNYNKDEGRIYYKFDKIVVYFSEYPVYEEQQKPGFPPELKFNSFKDRLVGHLKENFKSCLKTLDGKERPIVVIPTHRSESAEQVTGGIIEKAVRESIDPRNLIIMVRVQYDPERSAENYGYLMWAMQRPGIDGWESLPILGARSGVIVFFPAKDDLGEHFDSFGQSFKPNPSATTPDMIRKKPKERYVR